MSVQKPLKQNQFEGCAFVFTPPGACPVEVGCYRCEPRCYALCPTRRDMADFVGNGHGVRNEGNVIPHEKFRLKRRLRQSR